MMRLPDGGPKTDQVAWPLPPGACDAHGHIYGPFDRYPLPAERTFTPPEATLAMAERLWCRYGFTRAVLVQGAAYGSENPDHRALLDAIASNKETLRGIAVLGTDVADRELLRMDQAGIRGIRLNWIGDSTISPSLRQATRLREATRLIDRVAELAWHAELYLRAEDLWIAREVLEGSEITIVIAHMGRIDASRGIEQPELQLLLSLAQNPRCWIKLSGGDRVAANCGSLDAAYDIVMAIQEAAPNRTVWGFDWPHVNLSRPRTDDELFRFLQRIAPDPMALQRLLVDNPIKLYGFERIEDASLETASMIHRQGESV